MGEFMTRDRGMHPHASIYRSVARRAAFGASPSVMMQGSAGHPETVVVRSGLPKGEAWYEEESEVFTVMNSQPESPSDRT